MPEIGAQLYEEETSAQSQRIFFYCGSSSFKLLKIFKGFFFPANLKWYEQLDQLDK